MRFPLLDAGHEGESVVVWTTTPWTLPANVAAAVHPDGEYGLRENGEWVLAARYPDETFSRRVPGAELVGLRYEGPFDTLPPGASIEHRVVPWDEVSLEEGTGIVHIATGCGPEDFELGKALDLPVLMPIDEAGRFHDDYGWLHGLSTLDAARPDRRRPRRSRVPRRRRHVPAQLRALLALRHADRLSAVRRLVHLGRGAPADAARGEREGRVGPRRTWASAWTTGCATWATGTSPGGATTGSRCPSTPAACGHLNVIGSKAELEERALEGFEQLEELRRPWIDRVPIACEQCGERVSRIPEVGDVWLDAGIVPFATLGWQSPTRVPEGYATGAARGLTRADLPDHAYWERWFPADWVSEMREQIRLWFYSQFFMSVALVGSSPYRRVLAYEKMLDERGREMHASWGNTIAAEDAFAQMGADVMRWQYCAQPPNQNLLFGFGPAHEISRRLLTYWHSVKFLVDYANIEGFEPSWSRFGDVRDPRPLDRWLLARTDLLVEQATEAYEATLTVNAIRAFEAFVDDLSNWYIRRSRRRFYSLDEAAFRSLWFAVVQSLRVIAPMLPFLADHLWRILVPDGPASVHLAGWPERAHADDALLGEIGAGPPGRRARPPGAVDVAAEAAPAAAGSSSSRERREARRSTSTRSRTSCG